MLILDFWFGWDMVKELEVFWLGILFWGMVKLDFCVWMLGDELFGMLILGVFLLEFWIFEFGGGNCWGMCKDRGGKLKVGIFFGNIVLMFFWVCELLILKKLVGLGLVLIILDFWCICIGVLLGRIIVMFLSLFWIDFGVGVVGIFWIVLRFWGSDCLGLLVFCSKVVLIIIFGRECFMLGFLVKLLEIVLLLVFVRELILVLVLVGLGILNVLVFEVFNIGIVFEDFGIDKIKFVCVICVFVFLFKIFL